MRHPSCHPDLHRPPRVARTAARAALVLGAALLAGAASPAAWAQYKVVEPDGRVTYTDRPSAMAPGSRVSPVRAGVVGVGSSDAQPTLPPALRAVATRFPVTLITSSDCDPCSRARQLLRQRGVPYSERSVSSDADTEALQRQTGGRTVPALLVGQQVQRGLLDAEWQQTLDLAGYPRDSVLPKAWQPPPVQALTAASAAASAATGAAAQPPGPGNRAQGSAPAGLPTRGADPAAPGIRF